MTDTRRIAQFRETVADGAVIAYRTQDGGYWLFTESSYDMRGVSLSHKELDRLIARLQQLRNFPS